MQQLNFALYILGIAKDQGKKDIFQALASANAKRRPIFALIVWILTFGTFLANQILYAQV